MKKFGFILLSVALLGATSCTEEIIVSNETVSSDPIELTFTASSDEFDGQVNTRTLVREGGNVFWVANDRISLFANGTNNPFITKDGGIVSDFRGTVAEQAGTYYALYPYNSDATIDGTVVSTVLYHEQYAEPDSYASGMSLSVSLSSQDDAQDLGFKHSVSFLCVHISPDYQGDAIKFMELQGNNGEMLAGNVTINISPSDAAARIVEGEGQPVISLKQINADGVMIPGKSYYFVLAPQVLSQGYTLTLHNATGGTCLITENESVTFERNYINHITITDANFKQSEACDVREDGYPSETVYRLVKSFERDGNVYSLLNVFPGTGRKHQIRIHLSWMGCPIVGDKLYGESPEYYLAFVENRLSEEQRQKLILPYHALHAKSLSFTTFSGKEYYFECPPEKWFREFAMF